MINEESAFAIAAELLGRPKDDPASPGRLMEFPEGWLIREQLEGRGGVAKVIERGSGKIMYFSSRVAPIRIMEEYELVVGAAREVSASDD